MWTADRLRWTAAISGTLQGGAWGPAMAWCCRRPGSAAGQSGTISVWESRMPRRMRSFRRRRRRMPTALSSVCRTVTTLSSRRTGAACPRGRSSCCASPGLCSACRPCWFWTRRLPPSIRARRCGYRTHLRRWWRAGPALSWPTGFPLSRRRILSWWWRTEILSNRGIMNLCWRRTDFILRCITRSLRGEGDGTYRGISRVKE